MLHCHDHHRRHREHREEGQRRHACTNTCASSHACNVFFATSIQYRIPLLDPSSSCKLEALRH
ncbi:MAG: hypothetical protein MZW92_44035 [Comamonadaceae bacterium]|nr:hypothetical protein [Comamonadaceae bacterium]